MPLDGEYEPSPSSRVAEQVALYESSGGTKGATMIGLPVVILTTRGARSGKIRKTPLMRVEHEGRYAVVASQGGAPKHPVWYHNVVADPHVELQDGAVRRDMVAHEADGRRARRVVGPRRRGVPQLRRLPDEDRPADPGLRPRGARPDPGVTRCPRLGSEHDPHREGRRAPPAPRRSRAARPHQRLGRHQRHGRRRPPRLPRARDRQPLDRRHPRLPRRRADPARPDDRRRRARSRQPSSCPSRRTSRPGTATRPRPSAAPSESASSGRTSRTRCAPSTTRWLRSTPP